MLNCYRSKNAEQVDSCFKAELEIDNYTVPTWFVFTDTGKNDVMLGKLWFDHTRALIDSHHEKLVWPDDDPYRQIKGSLTLPPRLVTKPTISEQNDADRRDYLMEQAIKKEKRDRKAASRIAAVKAIGRPTRILKRSESSDELPRKPPPEPPPEDLTINLATVGAELWLDYTKSSTAVIGYTSYYEVNAMLEYKQRLAAGEQDIVDQMNAKLPHPGWAGAELAHFSKQDSDELPPHRQKVDHKIVLLDNTAELTTSPLFHTSIEHLKLMKSYLDDHLQKGFIVHSDAAFASPVLFAKKPNSS